MSLAEAAAGEPPTTVGVMGTSIHDEAASAAPQRVASTWLAAVARQAVGALGAAHAVRKTRAVPRWTADVRSALRPGRTDVPVLLGGRRQFHRRRRRRHRQPSVIRCARKRRARRPRGGERRNVPARVVGHGRGRCALRRSYACSGLRLASVHAGDPDDGEGEEGSAGSERVAPGVHDSRSRGDGSRRDITMKSDLLGDGCHTPPATASASGWFDSVPCSNARAVGTRPLIGE